MAATGYTPVYLYYSSTATNQPSAGNLGYGELAINITDGYLFYKDNANAIQKIGYKLVPVTAGGTGLTVVNTGYIPYGSSGTALTTSANLLFDGALKVGGIVRTNSNAATPAGGYIANNHAVADSRSWKLYNDVLAYGDFSIAQSTTQTGSTYASIMYLSPTGGVSIGNTTDPGATNLSVTGQGSFGSYLGIATTSPNIFASTISQLTIYPNTTDKYSMINLVGNRDVGGNQNGVLSFWNTYGTLTRTCCITSYNTAGSDTAGVLGLSTKTSAGTLTDRVWIDDSGNMWPYADNAYTCGKSGNRWSAVWAANGSIQTSDKNAKTDIVESPLGLDFINALRPVAYKFKVGKNLVEGDDEETKNQTLIPVPGKRQHFGLIAQEVKAILPEEIDFGGWVQSDLSDESSEQGLRYDEFIGPMIKAIQQLSQQVSDLQEKIKKAGIASF